MTISRQWKIPGIQGIDTRALTRHLRRPRRDEGLPNDRRDVQRGGGHDRARRDRESSEWITCEKSPRRPSTNGIRTTNRAAVASLAKTRRPARVTADSISHRGLRLRDQATTSFAAPTTRFRVTVVPATLPPPKEVLGRNPDGVFLSNGPEILPPCLTRTTRSALPGGKSRSLDLPRSSGAGLRLRWSDLQTEVRPSRRQSAGERFAHRGVAITSQNHGFAVDPKSLPPNDIEVTHINLNDGTVEGMRHRELPIFSVQYHPEAAPGPHDAAYFFPQFAELIEKSK